MKTKKEKCKVESSSFLEVTTDNAHRILAKLSEELNKFNKIEFGVYCNGDDNPVLKAAIVVTVTVEDSLVSEYSSVFETLKLACIRKRGTIVAGERSISMWKLSELYNKSPFKDDIGMTLEEYAFWMRMPVEEVERIFCQELINELMKYGKRDSIWRIWNGIKWVEIDPWKFAIEVDLYV